MNQTLLELLLAGMLAGAGLLLPVFAAASEPIIIDKQRSLYQLVHIVEQDGLRCMRFRKTNRDGTSQSCIDLRQPQRLVFFHYRQAMAASLILDRPQRILMIGLGGGVLTGALRQLYPDAHIDAVEIDPVVVAMARKYFEFDDQAMRVNTTIMDGRVFVKRAIRAARRYDLVVLDAFNGDYIPEHMLTREFLREVRQLLVAGGIVVANTHSTSALFDHESVTYEEVFGRFLQVRLPQSEVSRVIIAGTRPLPQVRTLVPKANRMRNRLRPFGIDALMLADAISDQVNWDAQARVLTDQFSPANLLKAN